MRIFISWSGERSEQLAKALREWLPLVIHHAEPWLSQADIQAGERWSVEIAKQLESTNFGIICVTPENLNSAWLLFEAGALAKSMEDGRVIPLLLDLEFKNISGPLAQFQAKKADAVGLRELVNSLNKAESTPVPEAHLGKLFSALFPELEKQISEIPKINVPAKSARSQGEILEELVGSVRGVEVRMREMFDDDFLPKRRRRNRIHPGMLIEMAHRIGDGPNDPIQILIAASSFREEVPWLYEFAVDAYRAIKSGNKNEAHKARRRLMNAIQMIDHTPLGEELGIDRRSLHFLLRDMMPMLDMVDIESGNAIEETRIVRKRADK